MIPSADLNSPRPFRRPIYFSWYSMGSESRKLHLEVWLSSNRLKMTSQSLLSGYSLITTVILIFLCVKNRRYRKWYRILLINPDDPLRVKRFFIEIEPVFQRFYPLLDRLKSKLRRQATEYYFQFRWLA